MINFFDPDGLACQGYAEIDFLVIQAKTSAAGDHNRAIVERIVRFWNPQVGTRRSRINLGRAFHGEGFMRPLLIELLQEGVKLGLLLQEVGAGGTSGFFLQGQMHPFMTTVLLGMAGTNPLNGDSQAQPPYRELGKLK